MNQSRRESSETPKSRAGGRVRSAACDETPQPARGVLLIRPLTSGGNIVSISINTTLATSEQDTLISALLHWRALCPNWKEQAENVTTLLKLAGYGNGPPEHPASCMCNECMP